MLVLTSDMASDDEEEDFDDFDGYFVLGEDVTYSSDDDHDFGTERGLVVLVLVQVLSTQFDNLGVVELIVPLGAKADVRGAEAAAAKRKIFFLLLRVMLKYCR